MRFRVLRLVALPWGRGAFNSLCEIQLCDDRVKFVTWNNSFNSLCEIRYSFVPGKDVDDTLSILYVRFGDHRRRYERRLIRPFNSLCEIHINKGLSDIWGKLTLSILYVRFCCEAISASYR